jgi:hypothetical protein
MFTTVTAALAALPTNGGEIILLEGDHVLDSGGTTLPEKGVTVRGVDTNSVIVKNVAGSHGFIMGANVSGELYRYLNFSLESQNTSVFSSMIYVDGSSATCQLDVEVDSLKMILADKGCDHRTGIQFKHRAGDQGIFSDACTGTVKVNNVTVEGGQKAVWTRNTLEAYVSNSFVTGQTTVGLHLAIPDYGIKKGRLQVSNCEVDAFKRIGVEIDTGGVSNVLATNNFVRINSGVSKIAGPGRYTGMQIVGNNPIIKGNMAILSSTTDYVNNLYGIYIDGTSSQGSVEGNTIVSGVSVLNVSQGMVIK